MPFNFDYWFVTFWFLKNCFCSQHTAEQRLEGNLRGPEIFQELVGLLVWGGIYFHKQGPQDLLSHQSTTYISSLIFLSLRLTGLPLLLLSVRYHLLLNRWASTLWTLSVCKRQRHKTQTYQCMGLNDSRNKCRYERRKENQIWVCEVEIMEIRTEATWRHRGCLILFTQICLLRQTFLLILMSKYNLCHVS